MEKEPRLRQPEKYAGWKYKDAVLAEHGDLPFFKEFIRYNEKGELILNGVNVPELVAEVEEAPFELVFPEIVVKQSVSWESLSTNVAEMVKYRGGMGYLAASKASPEAITTIPSLMSKENGGAGWDMETSSGQDLSNLEWMIKTGLVEPNKRIVCNGPKLHETIDPGRRLGRKKRTIYSNSVDRPFEKADKTYAELIVDAHKKGRNIEPVLDGLGELDYLEKRAKSFKKPMKVGLRLKAYGLPKNNNNLETLRVRLGMNMKQMWQAAERIERNPKLEINTFHAMVGAGETMEIDTFVDSLMVCANEYFKMAKIYPDLTRFNIGGGVPPMGSGWDHEVFLAKFLSRMQAMADERDQNAPTIDWEFGSLPTAESSHHIIYAAEEKINHVDKNGETVPNLLIEGSFMRMIPDTWIIDKDDWIIIAANNANEPVRLVRLGGLTCDSDDEWPPKYNGDKSLLAPDNSNKSEELQVFAALNTGSYQKQLAGMGGAGHCGLKEAGVVVVYTDKNGRKRFLPIDSNNREKASEIMGYTKETAGLFE
jgi:arginine decarboxylase